MTTALCLTLSPAASNIAQSQWGRARGITQSYYYGYGNGSPYSNSYRNYAYGNSGYGNSGYTGYGYGPYGYGSSSLYGSPSYSGYGYGNGGSYNMYQNHGHSHGGRRNYYSPYYGNGYGY